MLSSDKPQLLHSRVRLVLGIAADACRGRLSRERYGAARRDSGSRRTLGEDVQSGVSSFLLFAKAVIIMELPLIRLGVTAIPRQSWRTVRAEGLGISLSPSSPGCIQLPKSHAAGATIWQLLHLLR